MAHRLAFAVVVRHAAGLAVSGDAQLVAALRVGETGATLPVNAGFVPAFRVRRTGRYTLATFSPRSGGARELA